MTRAGEPGGTFTVGTVLPVATLAARLHGAAESLQKARHGRLPDELIIRCFSGQETRMLSGLRSNVSRG
jgi:hypothetical protein